MAAVLRRVMVQRSAAAVLSSSLMAFRPTIPPDRFMPLADRIRDLGVGVAFPRINLDGLVPPTALPPANRREADAAREILVASLTVEEVRKVIRATQMEAYTIIK